MDVSASTTSGTSDPAAWLTDLFGGMVTATGLRVGVREAMTVPGIAACVQVLSEDIAKVPLILYRRTTSGRERATNHPLYRLLKERPAPWLSSFMWRRALIANACTRDNGFSRVYRDRFGRVERLRAMPPGSVTMRWADDGEPFFDIDLMGQRETGLSYRDVIHVPYRATNDGTTNGGIFGCSPITQHREAIALAVATERFSAKFFANGARPSAVIEMDAEMPDEETAHRIRAGLERAMSGTDNSFRLAVLELGMKFKEVSSRNDQSQLSEIREFQAEEMARLYRVPPPKVGLLRRCMPAETLVFTEFGPQRIVDVKVGDRVWSVGKDLHLTLSKVLNFWDNGEDEIIEVRTTNRTVRCSPQHRLLVRRPHKVARTAPAEWCEEYVKAADLQVGDTLVTLKQLPNTGLSVAPNGRKLTVGFMEFCGLLVGDGNVFDGSVTIARSSKAAYMDHYRKVIMQEFTAGGNETMAGERHHQAKLSEADITAIRAMRPRIKTISAIARKYGADITTVSRIGLGHEYDCDHPCAGISAEDLSSIKAELAERTTVRRIAREYGMSLSQIKAVLSGKSWNGAKTIPERAPLLREYQRSTTFSSVAAANELRNLGFSGTAFTKSVPGWVFGLSEDLRLAFLRGILDSDGSVDKKGRISIAMVNRRLVSQIRHLCMSCGIPVTNMRASTVTRVPPEGKRQVTTTLYCFTCSDPGANRRIGSHDARYIERLESGKPFDRKERRYPRFGGEGFSSDHLSLSRIATIKRLPSERVFDIEVEENHCFIADGVVSHNSTYSNIEHLAIEYVTDAIAPLASAFEQQLSVALLSEAEQEDYFIELELGGLLRGDIASRYKAFATARQWGWLSVDEIREMENRNALPDGAGAEYLRPLNMSKAGEKDEQETEQ